VGKIRKNQAQNSYWVPTYLGNLGDKHLLSQKEGERGSTAAKGEWKKVTGRIWAPQLRGLRSILGIGKKDLNGGSEK